MPKHTIPISAMLVILYDYRMQLRKITMYKKCFFQPSWSPRHNYWQPTKALKNFYDHDLYLCHKVMTSSHMHSCLPHPSSSDSKRKYSTYSSVPSRSWCLGLFLLGFAGREQGWHSWLVHSKLPSLIPGDISPFCVALTFFKCPKNRALMERGR